MNMTDTDKLVCRELVRLLSAHGVRRVFVSPGSRNAPIIVALARWKELHATVVIDERCAAFMAVGYASASAEPVALVCTSGTALLNYAPAVAEAYYRRLPLIVVSADRPSEWIDQDDSQTLRQHGALANYVKLSVDIPEVTTDNLAWYANRAINDALITATTGRRAPVHINIQLDAPLGRTVASESLTPRLVRVCEPDRRLPDALMEDLRSHLLSTPKVMVIAGFNPPDPVLSKALEDLARWPNVVVLTETIANLHSDEDSRFVERIDTTLSDMSPEQKVALAPDVVITLGGALVSRFIKEYLRGLEHVEHWHVGVSHTTIDCFRHLNMRIEAYPADFFAQIAACPSDHNESQGRSTQNIHQMAEGLDAFTYSSAWHAIYHRAIESHDAYIRDITWSDMKAFATFLPNIPSHWHVYFSNGTPIRYAQLFGDISFAHTECNRGVSGIDGCTSTAIGGAMASPDTPTLLVSGDMSAQYDVGALASAALVPNFKMIVMCNGGGGIFRFIRQTASLPELDHYFAVDPNVPLRSLAEGYGLAYYEAKDLAELNLILPAFIVQNERPAMLAIHTPAIESAEILKNYFRRSR